MGRSKRVITDGERSVTEMMATCPGFRIQWYHSWASYNASGGGKNHNQTGCGYPNWEELYPRIFGHDFLDRILT